MSSFLSRKYLELRNAQLGTRTIDHDHFCVACGHNVRGLTVGRNCPECGTAIPAPSSHIDGLLSGDEAHKGRVKVGLMLIAACLFIAATAALLLFVFTSLLGHPYAFDAYLWLALALCGGWITGVWLLTSPHFKARYGNVNWLRLTARFTAFLWLPGHVLWMIASMWLAGTAAGDALLGWSFSIRFAAGVGGLFFAYWLMRLADDADLEDAANQIHLAMWMLPVPTLMLALLPDTVQWIFLALIGMVMLTWCWFVVMMGRGVLAMQRHVSWGIRNAIESAQRHSRMLQKREELQRQAEAQVRPVPAAPQPDISIQPNQQRS